jgi:hypothetical protein
LHQYEETRRSFEILFPRLREGGLYIIEDWQSSHLELPGCQGDGRKWSNRPTLTNFIFELLIAYGGHPDLFWNIVVRDWFVAAQKGSYPIDAGFRLDSVMKMRGKNLGLI